MEGDWAYLDNQLFFGNKIKNKLKDGLVHYWNWYEPSYFSLDTS
jgi:hypothetical protein